MVVAGTQSGGYCVKGGRRNSAPCAAGRYYGKGGGGGGGYYSQGLRSITVDLAVYEAVYQGKGGDGGGPDAAWT